MQFLCIFTLIFFLLFELIYNRKIHNVSLWFVGIWLFIVVLASLKLLGLYAATEEAYLVITLGVFAFEIGTKLPHRVRFTIFGITSYKNNTEVDYGRFRIAFIICVIALLPNILMLVKYFTGHYTLGQIYQVMAMTASGDNTELTGEVSDNLIRLQQYIGYPLLYLLVPTAIAMFESTKQKKYMFGAILLTILRFLYDVRKTFLVMLVIWSWFIYKFAIKKNDFNEGELTSKEKIKKNVQSLLIVGSVFALFMYSSISRADYSNGKYSLFQNMYYYYGGSVPYLGYRLDTANLTEYTLGFTSFRGVLAPIFAVIGMLGIKEPELLTIATNNINSLHSVITTIAPGHRYNSYATMFFQFFQDGGYVGVIILSLLYGYYAAGLQKKYVDSNSIRYRVKLAYFLGTFILFSMLHFNGCVICYVWPLIIDGFLYKNIQC